MGDATLARDVHQAEASDPDVLQHFEGLVRKTAARYVGIIEDDFEDICQVLRLKVWRALLSFDPKRSRLSRDAYVFGCVRNQVKDLLKRPHRNWLFIEDLTKFEGRGPTDISCDFSQRFEQRYLQVREDEVFGEIDEDDPLIPSTLTKNERKVLVCMYLDYSQANTALRLGLSRKEVATSIATIREKMADWHPSAAAAVVEITTPLKQAA